MSISPIIRSAEANDCVAMHQLIEELAHYEKAPQEVISSPEILEHALFSNKAVAKAWVAVVDNKVVGMAICYVRYSTWKGPCLYLEDLVVTETQRQKGIGSQLFEACKQYASGQKYHRMVWQVLDWNTPAIEFYKKYSADFESGWLNAWVNL